MPKVLEERGCKVYINTDDHPPAHVHVKVGGGVVIFLLDAELTVRKSKGVSQSDLQKARQVVQTHLAYLIQKWDEIHN